jgi:hypothetical protein
VRQKMAPKHTKKIRKEINGRFNNMGSADGK